MRALVTGSTGFIGAALCRALLENSFQVRALHRPSSNLRLLADLDVERVVGDLSRLESLEAAMQGVDVVFHAAALMGGSDSPGRQYAVTVEGTRYVLQAALAAGVQRLVHTSSVSALGVPALFEPDRTGMDETKTWNFRPDRWPYAYAKYLAEMEVQKAVSQGLDAVIVNPSVVIGPGDIYRQTSSIIVQVAKRKVPVAPQGGLNVIHISDVASGHLAALERGRRGERYILGGENMLHETFLSKIATVCGVTPPGLVVPAGLMRALGRPYRIVEAILPMPVNANQLYLAGYHFYYDIRKARLDLTWSPKFNTGQAIQDACQWFTAVGAIQSG